MTRRPAHPTVMQTSCLLFLLGTTLLIPAAVAAQEDERPEIVGVRVGLAGRYKVGVWTAVKVRLRGGGRPDSAELSLTVPDGDGVPSRVSTPVAKDETSVLSYLRFGRIESELAVELRVDDRVVGRKVFGTAATADDTHFLPAIAATRKVIVSVGVEPLGVEEAVALLREKPDRRPVVVRLKDCSQLPTQWYGYEGIDALVLSTSGPEILSDLVPGNPRFVALQKWIQMGGKLVLCVGSRAERVLAAGKPLTRLFAPGELRLHPEHPTFTLDETRALETYCESSHQISQPLRVSWLKNPKGVIDADEADLPLVVRTPRGFGQIVFFAADLDQRPLSEWSDRPLLVGKLLDLPTDQSVKSQDRSTMMHYGYDDLAGQLRSALDQFSQVQLVRFWHVAVLVVGYILLIGPADYFFLRKVASRRMQWTWVTFPAIVLAVSLAAYLLAHRLKGRQICINQVDLIDVDLDVDLDVHAELGRVRGTSWMNVFSPRIESFNLSLRSRLPDGSVPQDAGVLFSWLGLPGEALGGMNPRASNPVLWNEQYEFSAKLDKLIGVPIPARSSKSFTARWNGQTKVGLEVELAGDGQELAGRITNALGFTLSRCVLAYKPPAYDRTWAYDLGTLEPGDSIRLNPMTRQSALQTMLTEQQKEPAPYYRSSVDLPDILRAMMFYQAADGREYTGLSNGYQSFVDLSDLLKANRAILVAQGPDRRHGADLLCKDRNGELMTVEEDQHLTFYRFVIPVNRVGSQQ